jgi:type II secretory pathway pseudopilin PulG
MTLLELLVVLVVLAATAALVVPKFGSVSDQANYATSASTSADVTTNLESFKTMTGTYPDNFESLLDSDDSDMSNFLLSYHSASYTATSPSSLVVTALLRGGLVNVYDLDETKTDPTPKTTPRAIATTGKLATLTSGGTVAKKLYPPDGVIPSGYQVFAFGIGPNCSAVGRTMASAPTHSMVAGKDSGGDGKTDYYRYVALFEVKPSTTGFSGASLCRLRAVVDANGYTIDQRLQEYKQVTP